MLLWIMYIFFAAAKAATTRNFFFLLFNIHNNSGGGAEAAVQVTTSIAVLVFRICVRSQNMCYYFQFTRVYRWIKTESDFSFISVWDLESVLCLDLDNQLQVLFKWFVLKCNRRHLKGLTVLFELDNFSAKNSVQQKWDWKLN